MKHIDFDIELFTKLLKEGEDGDALDGLDDLDEFKKVDAGEWITEHKYENRSTVYAHVPTGRFVSVEESRSGSYWSDYEYDEPSLYEVFPQEITKTVYVVKKPA